MKKLLLIYFSLFTTLTIRAQTETPDVQLIKESRAASNLALAKKDIKELSKFWLDDFIQIRGNGTFLVGKDTIISTWVDLFKSNPTTSYIRTPNEIIISVYDPTMAWEKGTWEGINTYSKGGSYSAMWKKKENIWKIQAELFVAIR
ncbi:MAG: nuclear transport factor 2 family protein [Saprospiraceae bacterium]